MSIRHRLIRGLLLLASFLAVVSPPGGPRVAAAQAVPAAAESAIVVDFGGSDKLLVQDDAGDTYRVQYIGLRGPTRASLLHPGAAAFHGPLVIGQRVLLAADGQDEEEGYKLRHVYLPGSPEPVGASILAAGWAVAVPYPVEHRHRDLYLQVQEQAMAQQLNLWQPGLLGPAAAWRPADFGETGYVAADPRLHPFLEQLLTVPTGRSMVNRLVRIGSIMVLRDLQGAAGTTESLGNHIELDRGLMASAPQVMAVVIAHEGTHAVDHASAAMGLASFSCFEAEQRAFGVEAQTWSEFYGPNGKPDPRDPVERGENEILRFAQRGDLANFVRRSAGYERQCAGEGLPG